MRKVLIVSPHFPPVNAPDMQRVRLALPWLRTCGWEPTILALHPDTIERPVLDPLLAETYPADIRIMRVHGIPPRLTRTFGFGGFWLRAGRALRRTGDALLTREKFDLVFFSTTQFDAFRLGPRWLTRSGVPFVLDYQDPWVNDYYARTGTPPPGGRLRYALARRRALRHEPLVLRKAAAVVSVSPGYLDDLAHRYSWFDRSRSLVLPFGASDLDFAIARSHPPRCPLVPIRNGQIHLVATGRGGADLAPALRILFRAFTRFRDRSPAQAARFHLHFIGTSYAPRELARESVLPIAREFGLAEIVHEHPARVPYFEALNYLANSDAILALGSDDPAYNPSKIAACLLASRPVLAILHARSPALELACTAGACTIGFRGTAEENPAFSDEIVNWLEHGMPSPANHASLADLSAETMTHRLSNAFNAALAP